MRHTLRPVFAMSLFCLACSASSGEITLIGKASIPGDALDKCSFKESLGGDALQNRLGSFGSSIDFTGKDDLYISCDDRGPGNGAAPFRARFQTFRLRIDAASASPVQVEHIATTMLTDETGWALTGLASAFNQRDQRLSKRFDAEGVRIGADGRLWISDEYGPWIDEFSIEGKRTRRLEIPSKFLVDHPSEDPDGELPPTNLKGRQPNHGFEGLAISPDKSRLWAATQAPLIQDGALSASGKKIGTNTRILEILPATNATREWVYQLSAPGLNVNEALAIDDHRLILIERDGKAAKVRGLYIVDLSGATDVSKVDALPSGDLPAEIVPAKKTAWLNLMDPKFGLAADMPEKIEGLTFGPNLPDGRRTLIVTTDNDLISTQPSWFWVFAFEPKDLIGG